jgi:hypothetical protein
VKLELNDQERRAVDRSLTERRARLVEIVDDRTQHPATRRAGSREAEAVASVLRKLHAKQRRERKPPLDIDAALARAAGTGDPAEPRRLDGKTGARLAPDVGEAVVKLVDRLSQADRLRLLIRLLAAGAFPAGMIDFVERAAIGAAEAAFDDVRSK